MFLSYLLVIYQTANLRDIFCQSQYLFGVAKLIIVPDIEYNISFVGADNRCRSIKNRAARVADNVARYQLVAD